VSHAKRYKEKAGRGQESSLEERKTSALKRLLLKPDIQVQTPHFIKKVSGEGKEGQRVDRHGRTMNQRIPKVVVQKHVKGKTIQRGRRRGGQMSQRKSAKIKERGSYSGGKCKQSERPRDAVRVRRLTGEDISGCRPAQNIRERE